MCVIFLGSESFRKSVIFELMLNIIILFTITWLLFEKCIDDRNVDGSRKHSIEYHIILFLSLCYIEPQLSSYLHRIPRQKFEHYFRFDVTCGSACYSLCRQNKQYRGKESCCTTLGEFSWLPHESHAVEDDACAIVPSIHSFSWFFNLILSLVTTVWRGFLAVTTVNFAFFPASRFFHRIMRTVMNLPKYRDVRITLQEDREE